METQQNSLAVPIAIVLAGALIAIALYFGGGAETAKPVPTTGAQTMEPIPAVTASDHIIGNPNAPVKIVEYTDLECPFCKQFHGTMKRIMDEYGADGRVAWVMRNFPLAQIHPNAPALALAAECVAELGGNAAYWDFLDEIFTRAPINTFFDFEEMDAAVAAVSVDTGSFQSCVDSQRHAEKIQQQLNDAVASGGQGTPFNVLVTRDGKNIEIAGAQPYEIVKSAIEAAL